MRQRNDARHSRERETDECPHCQSVSEPLREAGRQAGRQTEREGGSE